MGPAQVHLGLWVTVVEDHGEEFFGGPQHCLFSHLEADGAAVGEAARGRVKLANRRNQLVGIVFELFLQHDPELGRPVLSCQASQLLEELVSLVAAFT